MRTFLVALAAFLAGFFACRLTAKPPPPPPEVRGAVLVDEYGAAVVGSDPQVLRTMPNEDGSVRVIVKVSR
jgi:hypothetical protein